ncbi:YraN family protein [Planctomycetota bacterium]
MFGRARKPSERADLGRWGERQAERFLRKKGWTRIERNYTCRSGEIDLIMTDPEGTLVFVEVKTRQGEHFQPVETAITPQKKTRMRRAARLFLSSYDTGECPCRFDVVAIVAGPAGAPEIRHYPRAFTM